MSEYSRRTSPDQIVFVLCILIGSVFKWEVNCLGTFEVRFVSYNNPGGKGDNGHCCDGKWRLCESGGGCDHYFIVCIDSFDSRDDSISKCPLGSKRTSTIHNAATNSFGSTIGSTPNPLSFNFTRWQSGVRIKVDVWDDDSGRDDKVDFLKTNPPLSLIPSGSDEEATWTRTTLSARTSLVVEVRAFCGVGWFGDGCSVFCASTRGPDAFYTCDSTGRKICDDGWTGVNCDQNIDDCASSPCQNRGRCEDGLRNFTCHCRQGYEGVNCEIDVDECIGVDCHNGRCVDGDNSYSCQCELGFRGETCEETDACLDTPCRSNGTCLNAGDGFNCICEWGWTGQRCEQDVDECLSDPCKIGRQGIDCENTANGFVCTCQTGWSGSLCEIEIDECQSNPCANNGTCIDHIDGFTCNCTDDWTSSSNCLIRRSLSCDEQVVDLCHGNGECVDVTPGSDTLTQMAAVRCQCAPGWTGVVCEERMTTVASVVETECSSSFGSPCLNGGTCIPLGNEVGFQCQCPEEYSGIYCQIRNSGDSNEDQQNTNTDQNSISWSFEGQLTDDDLDNLRELILNVTTGNGIIDEEDSEKGNIPYEVYDAKGEVCDSDSIKYTVFSFRLKKGEKIVEQQITNRILEDISADSFDFLLPRVKFLSRERIQCIRKAESAMLSEKTEHRSWPIVLGCILFAAIVVAAIVAAALYVHKRNQRKRRDLGISSPIYIRGTEDQGAKLNGEGTGTRYTFDRDSQNINSNLFLIPNPTFDQTVDPGQQKTTVSEP